MALLPSATTSIDVAAGSFGAGTDYLTIIAPVGTAADGVPRVFTSTAALLAKHAYAPGVDYAAIHFEETGKPVIFVGVEAATEGAVSHIDSSQVSGNSVITVTGTPLEELDLELVVTVGGTVGSSLISFDLSLDGGVTSKSVRLGTASSYAIPYVGITLNFAAGTLLVDDIFTCRTSAPLWDQTGLQAAREALAAQKLPARSWLIVGDCADDGDSGDVVTEANAYETSSDRFVYARVQARDRRRLIQSSRAIKRMTGSPTLTFLEVGSTGDTITRSAGSFISDGFAVGDVITVAGSVSNNVTGPIASMTATVITLGTTDLANEGPVAGCSLVGSVGLTFAEVGSTGDTITRVSGSWLHEGFVVGDVVTITGTASNNVSGAIASLSATVLTFDTTDLAAEVIGSHNVSVTTGEIMADWVSNIAADFEDTDDEPRIDIAAGRGRKLSPITGWKLRRPAAWAASVREFQHDVQIPTWRKTDGSLSGWDLEDEDGTIVEYDERTQGGLLAARFTCMRTWANGPNGAFIALSMTRAPETSLLSRTHNMAVANVFCAVVQGETENAIGQVLELKPDGTGSEASLSELEERVNSALAIELLQRKSEGPRASGARWTASRTDILNIPGAELTGVGDLLLNGTIEKITTRVRVQQGG